MLIKNQREVREVIILGGAPTITLMAFKRYLKYEIICAYDRGLENIAVTI